MPGQVVTEGIPNVCGGQATKGIPTVRVGGAPIMVSGSPVTPHRPPIIKPLCLTGAAVTVARSNSTVRAGGLPIVVSTDADSCGHSRGTGNPTVRIG